MIFYIRIILVVFYNNSYKYTNNFIYNLYISKYTYFVQKNLYGKKYFNFKLLKNIINKDHIFYIEVSINKITYVIIILNKL